MSGHINTWRNRYNDLEAAHLTRVEREFRIGDKGRLFWKGQEFIDLSSNFYLGRDLKVVSGDYGSSGSRLITGTSPEHINLEASLSEMHKYEASILFNSGYHANTGVIPTLARKSDLLISDELNHGSIVDGCRLSKADLKILNHNDISQLERILSQERKNYENVWVICESIYSMDGDCAPLIKYRELCDSYEALLMVDESHALGVRGAGRGLCHELGLSADLMVGTFAKSYAAFGAFVSGSDFLVKILRNTARSYLFSTALPPAVINFISHRISWIQKEEGQLEIMKLQKNCELVRELLGLDISSTHIVPILIDGNERVLKAAKELETAGVMVHGIRSPTVKVGTERLRISLRSNLSESDIRHSCSSILNVLDRY